MVRGRGKRSFSVFLLHRLDMKRLRVSHTHGRAEPFGCCRHAWRAIAGRAVQEKEYEDYFYFIILCTGPDFIGVHQAELVR